MHLKSSDVIHSFFVPVLRLKQDTLPGREILQWFQATKTGKYEIPCAELCGFGHSGMLGHLTVHSAEDYDASGCRRNGPRAARRRRGRRALTRDDEEGGTTMSHPAAIPRRTHEHVEHEHGGLHQHVHLLARSQDDREAVPVPGAVHDDLRRPVRAAGALAAGLSGAAGAGHELGARAVHVRGHHPAGVLQHAVHHARHDHDLLRGHADAGGLLRQLPHPADDRHARHGVPGHQHAVVLDRRWSPASS